MADRTAFYGETEIWDFPEVGPPPASSRPDALDPAVSKVFAAIDGLPLADQLAALESSLDAVRAAFEVGLILPADTFLSMKMDTEFN